MSNKTAYPQVRAALYARISHDTSEEGKGVQNQLHNCRRTAEAMGWAVKEEYVDNDISAYSNKVRPQLQAMLQAVRERDIDAIVVWHYDRLYRRVIELEDLIQLAESTGVQLKAVESADFDLTTPAGRMFARNLVNLAQYEIEHGQQRMIAKKEAMARAGEYRGGPRPYGYEADGVTVRESEAEVVRRATKYIIVGRTLAAVARELNEERLTTSTGRPWTYARLRDVLVRPRNAGKLSKGRHGRNEDYEIIGNAKWPAIVGFEEWSTVYKLLTDPSRRKQNGNSTKWLGSGIYNCGKCGAPMRPAPHGGKRPRTAERKYLYRCSAHAHLTVSARPTDEFVRAVLAELLRDPRIVAAFNETGEEANSERYDRLQLVERLKTFKNDYIAGHINGKDYKSARAEVEKQIAEIDDRLVASVQRSASTSVFQATDPGEEFLRAPIDIQRAVLTTVARVEIASSPYRGSRWSEERVLISPAE